MKSRTLLLAALALGLCGGAFAQAVVTRETRVYSSYDADTLNPVVVHRPWLNTLGAPVVTPYGYDVPDSTVFVSPPRRHWRRRYSSDINLGGYPAGYPSYQYKYYHP
jgi:hypothetical protein